MTGVYLDHAATTPVRAEVLEAMWPFFSNVYGNPSSVHSNGSLAQQTLLQGHESVAEILGCRPSEVIFTAGGTEADNLAILGTARAFRGSGKHVVTTSIEHAAVLQPCEQLEREGFDVTYVPVDTHGVIDLDVLERAMRADTILVSVMLANNEIGTIQPISEVARLAHKYGALVHTDAVQAAGALEIAIDALGVDLLTISAHKIYGPKGVGVLYVRRDTPFQPLLFGGGQEQNRRPGTENIPGVVGMAVALSLAERERPSESARLTDLRERLISGVLASVPGAHLTGHPINRLAGHASFYLDGMTGESVLVGLDHAGIACSSGSACRAGLTEPSHVLTAVGLSPALALNGLRMTLGRQNSSDDVDLVLNVLPPIVAEISTGVVHA